MPGVQPRAFCAYENDPNSVLTTAVVGLQKASGGPDCAHCRHVIRLEQPSALCNELFRF